ncbi:MAG: hypothetical protein GX446_02115 [Chthonomonadales bacterium]|nr:hypothetical protein [Chthonomonadales bacterium]
MTAGLVALMLAAMPIAARPAPQWRGVHFNPQVASDPNFPWLIHYDQRRDSIRSALADLRKAARMNLVAVFVMIPHSLREPARGNRVGENLGAWANTTYLDNVARFVDDCHAAGLSVELDLVDNRWIPHTVDADAHIGKPGNPWWPVADDDPWDEAAEWYRQVIEYVEAHARHPDAIAMWCMMGNYQWGAAEPVLWDNVDRPEIARHTERFIKRVWPVFRAAGKRPKAAPIMLPIFAAGGYWADKTPMHRLSAFVNLKRWLMDDLKLPPDYWPMSSYPHCDPAPDGFAYMRAIVETLGRGNARRILSTDLKTEGHDAETRDTILRRDGRSGADMLRWHIARCREYGFAGWWIWAYQDTPTATTGIRRLDGTWKEEMMRVIRGSAGR